MLRQTQPTAPAALQQLYTRLIKEEETIERERRTVHRHTFVRPVTIRYSIEQTQHSISAFSKNLSPLGIGLIMDQQLPEKCVAKLCIHCSSGRPVYILAEQRWIDAFGKDWYLTGWKFVQEING